MIWFYPLEEELKRTRRIMRRLMETFGAWPFLREFEEEIERTFPVDILETDADVIVRADLPGFSKEDVRVRATETTLEIEAERKEKKIEKTERMFRAERRFGVARRSLTLPAEVEPETAEATFENGVLEIRLKKKKPAKKVREIEIR